MILVLVLTLFSYAYIFTHITNKIQYNCWVAELFKHFILDSNQILYIKILSIKIKFISVISSFQKNSYSLLIYIYYVYNHYFSLVFYNNNSDILSCKTKKKALFADACILKPLFSIKTFISMAFHFEDSYVIARFLSGQIIILYSFHVIHLLYIIRCIC